ncbi:DNA circularization N-terminal domain-containing protein [Roseobacter sp. N2S]|uniref:DNA circularization N-terminal domain-containing protein n=1 Tax=Roseobacter sp. N2S TaxID=2663844 RepID=UPI00285EC6CE|nr:DNA circularization N-terminal domain-containing protein [Roseobacter sp. N2S]MDR6264083.1 hypothetical protein [Roseobacter sp. N2S]
MAETVLIGDLELNRVTELRVDQTRNLATHSVPGWDSDLVQDLGQTAARITLSGLALGPDAGTRLEELRSSFASGAPQDFVSSAAVGADIEQTLLESLNVVQSGKMPGGYAYSMSLRHYVPPPAPTIGGFSTDFLAELGDLDAALGLDAMAGLADALGQAQGALDAIDTLKDFVEDAAAFVEGAMGIQALLDAAGKVISASDT